MLKTYVEEDPQTTVHSNVQFEGDPQNIVRFRILEKFTTPFLGLIVSPKNVL